MSACMRSGAHVVDRLPGHPRDTGELSHAEQAIGFTGEAGDLAQPLIPLTLCGIPTVTGLGEGHAQAVGVHDGLPVGEGAGLDQHPLALAHVAARGCVALAGFVGGDGARVQGRAGGVELAGCVVGCGLGRVDHDRPPLRAARIVCHSAGVIGVTRGLSMIGGPFVRLSAAMERDETCRTCQPSSGRPKTQRVDRPA